ncbi:MAG: DegT/DnrJ/EryC1/StrS family aminotransferase [Pseudomonadota bacterium]
MENVTPIPVYQDQTHPILVTEPYLPSIQKYMKYVEQAFVNQRITNGGPLLQELTDRLKKLLGVKYLLIVNNGTVALQIAYKIKGIKNVISTPFTFPATLTSLMWSNIEINLCDIDKQTWNLCPDNTRNALTDLTIDGLVPVNIFGMPCDLDKFEMIRKEFGIPIIYDSAQALLSKYKGKSIYNYGDIHCISFHATKLFHSVEGGALVFKSKDEFEHATKLINFGIEETGQVFTPGINAKMSELHAAMGLCILDELPRLIENREESVFWYKHYLKDLVELQVASYECYVPPTYMSVKFATEEQLLATVDALKTEEIMARRYFYPANHKFIKSDSLHVLATNNQVTDKILCLPLMHDLSKQQIAKICRVIARAIK